MSLLPGQLKVFFQPNINDGDMRAQRGVVLRFECRQSLLAPVLLVSIFLHSPVIESRCFLDFRQILALYLIEILSCEIYEIITLPYPIKYCMPNSA